ncbi:MAG: phytanoyl-CoA dioxygenase family protein, partial [Myxococcota bacterium]
MLTEPQRRRYAEEGYLHLPGRFSSKTLTRLSDELRTICRFGYGPVDGVATPSPKETDEDLLRKAVAVHFPHKLSPPIREMIRHPVLVAVFTALLGPNVKCVQSMFFIRPSGGPGQAWHQDEHYVPSRDRSTTGAWIAIDPATPASGCLWVIPGSHRRGILWPHRAHNDRRFDPVGMAGSFPYTEADAVPLPVSPGDLIVFNERCRRYPLNTI